MKKLSLTALLATSALFGATDAQIIDFYKRMVPENVSVTIEQRDQNPQIKGYDIVTVKLSDGNQTQSDTIFAKDGLIFPDIIRSEERRVGKEC